MTYIRKLAILAQVLLVAGSASGQWVPGGGVTVTGQKAGDGRLAEELSGSADLVITHTWESGHELLFYLEGNTSAKVGGVSQFLPETNADAGSAVDSDLRGRVQLSELSYRRAFAEGRALTLGLVDISGYFDQSRIASDENTQFLGVPFVQNPTIEFPDYAFGMIYEHQVASGTTLRAGLTSSHGLADNPSHSYAQLVDVDNADKGVFAAASAAWEKDRWVIRSGAWAHTADHESLDGQETGLHNKGVFLLSGWRHGLHAVNIRLGLANRTVTRAAGFTALSYRYRREPVTLGLGVARIFLSPRETGADLDDTTQGEIYLRYRLRPSLLLTGDVQRLENSNFDASGELYDKAVSVYGVRLTFIF
jgi:porin